MDPVTLCNAALARLGEARIVDLLDDNVAARACHAMLPIARAEVLRSHRWNFATARATLAALGEAPAFGYARAYGLPADNLRVLEVNGVSGTGGPGAAWEVEVDTSAPDGAGQDGAVEAGGTVKVASRGTLVLRRQA